MIGTLSLGLTTDISSIVHQSQHVISAVVGKKKGETTMLVPKVYLLSAISRSLK